MNKVLLIKRLREIIENSIRTNAEGKIIYLDNLFFTIVSLTRLIDDIVNEPLEV